LTADGGVRVGLAPYSTDEDIDRLFEALSTVVRG
jgi:selenocysteine lyase/cysteine desulfurase